MSIQSNMKPYVLQKLITAQDEYGYKTETWVNVSDIEVSINSVYANGNSSDGLVYRNKITTGITAYKQFEQGTKYRLYSESAIYNIKDYIASRFTQLSLRGG